MDIALIEERVQLLASNIDPATFIFQLLTAYGRPKATVSKLQNGNLNIGKLPGEVIWKKQLLFRPINGQDLHLVADELRKSEEVNRHGLRFVVITDWQTLLAIDTKTTDTLDIPLEQLGKHYDFFLPWAGPAHRGASLWRPTDTAARVASRVFAGESEITIGDRQQPIDNHRLQLLGYRRDIDGPALPASVGAHSPQHRVQQFGQTLLLGVCRQLAPGDRFGDQFAEKSAGGRDGGRGQIGMAVRLQPGIDQEPHHRTIPVPHRHYRIDVGMQPIQRSVMLFRDVDARHDNLVRLLQQCPVEVLSTGEVVVQRRAAQAAALGNLLECRRRVTALVDDFVGRLHDAFTGLLSIGTDRSARPSTARLGPTPGSHLANTKSLLNQGQKVVPLMSSIGAARRQTPHPLIQVGPHRIIGGQLDGPAVGRRGLIDPPRLAEEMAAGDPRGLNPLGRPVRDGVEGVQSRVGPVDFAIQRSQGHCRAQ